MQLPGMDVFCEELARREFYTAGTEELVQRLEMDIRQGREATTSVYVASSSGSANASLPFDPETLQNLAL